MTSYDNITAREDASPLMPEDVAAEIIGSLPETSAVASVARQLPTLSRNQRRIPVWETLPYAYFVDGDSGLKETSNATWKNVYLNVEEIATILPIPEAVLDDAGFPIFEIARPYIVEAIGNVFDQAVLYGTNSPQSWPEGIVDGADNAGHTVEAGTGSDLYDDILSENGVLSKVEEDGFMVNGHLAALNMKAKLRGLRTQDGVPIFSQNVQGANSYALDGEPVFFPKNGGVDPTKSLLISGDWTQLVWAIRQDVTYKVLTEAVITDNNGAVVYNLAQQDMVALRVVTRLGWALPNPVNRVNEDEDTRYPFAVLTPASGS